MSRQPMTFRDDEATAALRERLRTIIREDLPESYRGAFVEGTAGQELANAFCRRLADEQLLTLNWPAEYGGAGASIWEQAAFREEMWAHHEPRGAQYMGLNWVGPSIMRFGTPEQRDAHLPAIAAGTATWCQGFSEPEAGSDLASLRLRGVRADDGSWRLSGQKIWTSYASLANWCFLTVRTDLGGPKQHGITIFLVPMHRAGVTVREIDSILGPHHLNEVFFDDVQAYDAEILGPVDKGWEVIRYVLEHERVGIARYARSDRILSLLAEHLPSEDEAGCQPLRMAHARLLVKARIARLMNYRSVAATASSPTPGAVSIARLASTLLDQDVAELALEILGEEGLSPGGDVPLDGWAEEGWRYARSSTIASGTTEIQRMLVARSMVRS
jgi:alkylation response protein AidB-like acyl-CoA dehydrogenase